MQVRLRLLRSRDKPTKVPDIARELGVVNVLEGSIRRSGDHLRVTAQLVRADNGYHLWSETYDRELEDIFAVQDDIAQSVVKELRSTLMGEAVDAKAATEVTAQMAAAIRGRATDPEVQRLYLHARYLINRLTQGDSLLVMSSLLHREGMAKPGPDQTVNVAVRAGRVSKVRSYPRIGAGPRYQSCLPAEQKKGPGKTGAFDFVKTPIKNQRE